jgi:hypothetical protein
VCSWDSLRLGRGWLICSVCPKWNLCQAVHCSPYQPHVTLAEKKPWHVSELSYSKGSYVSTGTLGARAPHIPVMVPWGGWKTPFLGSPSADGLVFQPSLLMFSFLEPECTLTVDQVAAQIMVCWQSTFPTCCHFGRFCFHLSMMISSSMLIITWVPTLGQAFHTVQVMVRTLDLGNFGIITSSLYGRTLRVRLSPVLKVSGPARGTIWTR